MSLLFFNHLFLTFVPHSSIVCHTCHIFFCLVSLLPSTRTENGDRRASVNVVHSSIDNWVMKKYNQMLNLNEEKLIFNVLTEEEKWNERKWIPDDDESLEIESRFIVCYKCKELYDFIIQNVCWFRINAKLRTPFNSKAHE